MMFNILKVTLTVVEVLVCFLLITAILIQKSKTQGAGLAFGSGVGETLFGGQIGNVMTKVTVILAVVFLLNTTVLTFMAVKAKYRRPVKVAVPAQVQPGGPATTAQPPMPGPDGGQVPAIPAPAE